MSNRVVEIIETKRLRLRPFKMSDAWDLFELAKDPMVGPVCGWPPHINVQNSMNVIDKLLSQDGNFAVTVKGVGRPVGAVGLEFDNERAEVELKENEAELGYWIGQPFWGMGYCTEAAKALLKTGFSEYELGRIYCGTYEGNDKSLRIIEKLGFEYLYTDEGANVKLMCETRVLHMFKLDREDFFK